MKFGEEQKREIIQNFTQQDIRELGIHQLAYIRPVAVDNTTAYAIHAADGTTLSIMEDITQARFVIEDNELECATLH